MCIFEYILKPTLLYTALIKEKKHMAEAVLGNMRDPMLRGVNWGS